MEQIFPKVLQAITGDDYTVYAYLNDGTVRCVDMKPMIAQGGVFEQLRDENFFTSHLTVLNDTVAWDLTGEHDPAQCIDIDPFTVADMPVIADPLETVI
ncbi:MAG: DUF2442 domain-containing protein [Eubacteriales bacterium]|nr:DUF2442 domain-containing protein [Eubacteriales bacterium]